MEIKDLGALTPTEKDARKAQFLDTLWYRHSVKEYDTNRIIPQEDFDFILEAGRLSPSSVGLEPWKFVVLQNADLRQQIADVSFGAKPHLPTASHVVLYFARKDTWYDSPYTEHICRTVKGFDDERWASSSPKYKTFQQVDMNIENDRHLIDWTGKQVYITLANMMTAAAHIGVDSCAIEGFNYDQAREILTKAGVLTAEWDLCVVCSFGYKVAPPKRTKNRQALETVVSYVS